MSEKNDEDDFDDWRSQMDSKYSGSVEYNQIISLNNNNKVNQLNFSELDIKSKNRIFDAIRFPPYHPEPLPNKLNIIDYAPIQDYQLLYDYKNITLNQSEFIAVFEFAEGLFQKCIEKAIDIRDGIIENGKYIHFLSKPPTKEENEYMQSTGIENLHSLQDDSLKLISEMTMFGIDKLNDTIDLQSIQYGNQVFYQLINKLKDSLINRSISLKHEVTTSAIAVDSLFEYTYSILSTPTQLVCKLDGFLVNWNAFHKIQDKVNYSNKSYNYAKYMTLQSFPICNAIFSYLQSSKSYGNILIIENYSFESGEFRTILNYFDMQSTNIIQYNTKLSIYQSIRKLIIHNCNFSDRDCHVLADKLYKFKYLESLQLTNNSISYSGIASISAMLLENHCNIRILRLDSNQINSDGAILLSQVLHKLPFLEILSLNNNPIEDIGLFHILKSLLNSKRKLYSNLIIPIINKKKRNEHILNRNNEDSDVESIATSSIGTEILMNKDDTIHEHNELKLLKRKIMSKCYFNDYFKAHFSLKMRLDYIDEFDESIIKKTNEELELWVNLPDEEYYYDNNDLYSSDDDDITNDKNHKSNNNIKDKESQYEEKSNYIISKQYNSMNHVDYIIASRRLIIKRNEFYSKCNKFIQFLMKIRIKLIAINAFTQLLKRGLILSSLNVANCKLTKHIVPTIVSVLIENHNIISFDASNNNDMLSNYESCELVSKLIEKGWLRILILNNCGINDRSFMEITRSASILNNSKLLHTLELSDNRLGPTSANCVATMSKTFYLDNLNIAGGFHVTAPFKKKGSISLAASYEGFDDDEDGDITNYEINHINKITLNSINHKKLSKKDKINDLQSDYNDDYHSSYDDDDFYDGDNDNNDNNNQFIQQQQKRHINDEQYHTNEMFSNSLTKNIGGITHGISKLIKKVVRKNSITKEENVEVQVESEKRLNVL